MGSQALAVGGGAAHLALRQATSRLHAEVEGLMPLSAPSVGPAEYRKHLELMLQWIGKFPDFPADSHQVEVAQAILRDLAFPDSFPTRTLVLPATAANSSEVSTATAWGFAYVLQGSQLGNLVLYRRWANALAPHPLDYLRGSGNNTHKLWTGFLDRLGKDVTSTQSIAECCIGAVAAFESLRHIISHEAAS